MSCSILTFLAFRPTICAHRKVGNLTEKMEMVKEKVSALVEWSYTVVERAWLDLGEASRQFIAGNKTAKQVKLKMKELESI